MTETEVKSRVGQHHTVLFGVEGQGGLVREVEAMKVQVVEHEKRLNVLSIKWLVLMGLAGLAGNSLGAALLSFVQTLNP